MLEQEKMQLNIGICDDEPAMVSQLEELTRKTLEGYYSLHVDTAVTSAELLSKTRPFQIALLDVQLLESTGIELARQILMRNARCRIIFVSGYLHAVSEVYEVPHFCFVLKEQMEEMLPRFLKRAADLCAGEAGRKIMISCGRKMEELTLSSVVSIERKGHVTFIKLLDGQVYQTKEKLTELLLRIRDENFIRCHVSFLVNLQNVKEILGSCFLMETGEEIPISRPNEGICREAFFRHLGEYME